MDPLRSWPSDWPIQSDDPLRGWSLLRTMTMTAAAAAGGAAPPDTSDDDNKNAAAAPRRRGTAKAINEDDEEEDDDGSRIISSSDGPPTQRSDGRNDIEAGDEHHDEDDTSDHLCPGGILKEMGTADVHWARGASATSTKKYLVILPGLLSLNHNPSSSSAAANAAAVAPTSTPVSATGSAAANSSVPPTILGRFRPPDTSTLLKSDAAQRGATLELCLGNDKGPERGGGALRLEGQAVKTTGKFLWITNLQKKKKTVTCKHVFDSILVFGNAHKVCGAAGDASVEADDSAGDHVPLHHYGASRRTVDGGNQLLGASASTPNKKMFTPKPVRVPVATSSAATPACNDAKPAPRPGKRSHKDLERDETDSEHSSRSDGASAEHSSSSDDEDDNRHAHADARGGAGGAAAASPRTPPDSTSRRRSVRALARKPVRYKDLEEEAVDRDSDDDDDVLNDDSEAAKDLDDKRGATNAVTTGRKRHQHQQQKDVVVDLTHADDVSMDLSSQKSSATTKRRLPIQEAAVADHSDAVEPGTAASPAIGMSKATKRLSREEAKEGEEEEVQSPTTMGSMAKATSKPAAKRARGAFGRSHLDLAGDASVAKAGRGNFGHEMASRRSADEEAVDDSKPVSSSPSLSANGSASPRRSREESPHKRRSSSAKKPSDLEMAVMAESAAAPSPAKSPSTALASPAPPPPSTSPLSASPAHLRIRTTPRPMKKTKKSVLDYIKDDAFD